VYACLAAWVERCCRADKGKCRWVKKDQKLVAKAVREENAMIVPSEKTLRLRRIRILFRGWWKSLMEMMSYALKEDW